MHLATRFCCPLDLPFILVFDSALFSQPVITFPIVSFRLHFLFSHLFCTDNNYVHCFSCISCNSSHLMASLLFLRLLSFYISFLTKLSEVESRATTLIQNSSFDRMLIAMGFFLVAISWPLPRKSHYFLQDGVASSLLLFWIKRFLKILPALNGPSCQICSKILFRTLSKIFENKWNFFS